ncbi:MAG: FIST C-terminal domain-containing protein [Treponema sp.]|jgi:hypothetical protein|nr:FIST C-terminal domain-containing protein [Treponema sp.]
MIRIFSACTSEIDDVQAAVAAIAAQLDAEQRLFKNSVGLLSCYAEFIESGVVAALAKALPFPLAGITTIAAASNGGQGEMLLFLTVLSSDDVEFVLGVTDPICGEDEAPLRAAWEKTGAKRRDQAALMLSFCPLLFNVSGDFIVDTWSAITGNVPNFGTLAVDHNRDYHESRTILNGEAYKDRYVFILLYGSVEPRFFIAGIQEEKAFPEKGVVTASQGNQLQAVNGISVADYLSGLGLTRDEEGVIKGINAYPFILDYNDGTQPIIRVMFAITPDGSAVCGGKMPVGATLAVGTINGDEVLATSTEILDQAAKAGEGKSILIFSCIGRFFSLGYESGREMEKARKTLEKVPFHLCYSGGELCPVSGKDGALTNRNHNDTMVLCVL